MKNGMPDFESFTTEKCVYTFGQQLLGFEQGIREIEENLEKGKNHLNLELFSYKDNYSLKSELVNVNSEDCLCVAED